MKIDVDSLNQALKWLDYSTNHPSWDMDEVLRDFRAGKSIQQAEKEYQAGRVKS